MRYEFWLLKNFVEVYSLIIYISAIYGILSYFHSEL
jgi:hypothetical protein